MPFLPDSFDPSGWRETISNTPPQYQRFFLFAALAAGMNYLHMSKHGRGHLRGYRARINLILAAVTGVLTGWAAREMGLADAYVNAIVAVAGYVGGDLLDVAGKALASRISSVLGGDGDGDGEKDLEP